MILANPALSILVGLSALAIHYGCITMMVYSVKPRYVLPVGLLSVIAWGCLFGLLWGDYGGL